jgi:hypothetical protein
MARQQRSTKTRPARRDQRGPSVAESSARSHGKTGRVIEFSMSHNEHAVQQYLGYRFPSRQNVSNDLAQFAHQFLFFARKHLPAVPSFWPRTCSCLLGREE